MNYFKLKEFLRALAPDDAVFDPLWKIVFCDVLASGEHLADRKI